MRVVVGLLVEDLAVERDLAVAVAALAHRARQRAVEAQVVGPQLDRLAQRLLGLARPAEPLEGVRARDVGAQRVRLVLQQPLRHHQRVLAAVRLDVDLVQREAASASRGAPVLVEQQRLDGRDVAADAQQLHQQVAAVRVLGSSS